MNWLYLPFGVLYVVISMAFFLFGFNLFYLSAITLRRRRRAAEEPPHIEEWPMVTVQLPIFNELYVAQRLIDCVAQFDYPSDQLQIQVLDDSTDETKRLVRTAVSKWHAQGLNIVHVTRSERSGFKAGALQHGLETAVGEFIAIFDADFVPQPDFLRQTIPQFQDRTVGFVQTRWGHLNRGYSWFTKLQALMIDAHFMVEQFGRSQGGYWFNFNGTAGVWRRAAMDEAGGWRADTLTEDLDLSYRAFLKGWHGRYLRHIIVPAELPVHFSGFRRQQHRWANGSLACAVKLIRPVLKADASSAKRYQSTLHLLGYAIHLLLFLTLLIYPVVVQIGLAYPAFQYLYGLSFLLGMTAVAPTLFFILGQWEQKRPLLRQLPMILLVSIVGSGMMFNTTRAAWQLVRKRHHIFERTAKFGLEDSNQSWQEKRYQLRFDGVVYWELFFGLYALITGIYALHTHYWGVGFYALFFAAGLLLVAGVTIVETVSIYHHRRERAKTIALEEARWRA